MKSWLKNVLLWTCTWALLFMLFNWPIKDWRHFMFDGFFPALIIGTIFFFTEKRVMNFIKKQFGEKKREEQ